MKKCKTCSKFKLNKEFSKDSLSSDGLKHKCKSCANAYKLEYYHSKDGLISKMYSSQKKASKTREHPAPMYTLAELREWVKNQSNFNTLYSDWVTSDYKKEKVPSCDRLNDYKGYSFDNMRLVTWKENEEKGNRDRINGVNNKKSKTVLQYDKDMNFIQEYNSTAIAARALNIVQSNISRCCNNKRNSAGGFIWKYK